MRHSSVIIVSVLAAAPLAAQTATRGDPVRVTAPAVGLSAQEGTLLRVNADSLSFQPAAAKDTVTVATAAITQFEINYGNKQHSQAGKGALVGGVIGVVAGAALGAAGGGGSDQMFSSGSLAAAGAITLGLIGAGVGALIGAGSHTAEWRTADPSKIGVVSAVRLTPTWDPRTGRAGLSVALRF